KSLAGRKPWDEVIIFKSLVLQALYNLSDDQAEYQLRDRLSFMRFLGLELEDTPRLCGSIARRARNRYERIILFVETFIASVQIEEAKLSHANIPRSESRSFESDLRGD